METDYRATADEIQTWSSRRGFARGRVKKTMPSR
jgi:hypothetical protein